MSLLNSLKFKFVAGFMLIIIPVVAFMYYNNLYAIEVVREQVSGSNSDLLADYVEHVDKLIDETNRYLLLIENRDEDIDYLNILDYGTDEYLFAKQRVNRRYQTDIGFLQFIDSLFLYNIPDNDLIVNTRDDYTTKQQALTDYVREHKPPYVPFALAPWQLMDVGGEQYFVKAVQISDNLFIGALISVRTVTDLELRSGAGAAIVGQNGEVIAAKGLLPSQQAVVTEMSLKQQQPYEIVTDPADKSKYLMVGIPSSSLPVKYVILIPEESMLENLPFFRLVVYIVPLGGGLILLFYLLFLRKVLLRPMKKLVYAMQRIARGDWGARLDEGSSREFDFVARTFNYMVSEISNLKIDVYEQQLLTKEAEFKHLQVQIKPHFYLNSLNIISSLASTKKCELIQSMTRYLGEHFRFSMSTQRRLVTLDEEMKHTMNYLEIQMLRFPKQLAYEIELPDAFGRCPILPLVIQTFVENSIIHGFVRRRELFLIRISVEADPNCPDGGFSIYVRDNGKGFPQEVLDRLERGDFMMKTGEGHLGIQNVLLRLQMKYGDQAAVLFSNHDGGGAVVQIRLPAIQPEAEEDGHEWKAVASGG